ncbi:hypothetical protein SDRG_15764 [Saprolegnia diclina VS20]|uniref:Uncharacterized protein n=1 Tax=Saprolegnia diclina (strain VS20) TaxID=1156394 RepID=T0PM10_SAPDV|nr:hypothetical protein SDRG_15764 [Saprolegnia diclina VS20]EQC26419.1 hypothetical protein SDRG_15764 [Saprolegnia diclina VS20]|eukprot:XP_008620168.1 hypothetical protein SDRG_15764 [Saprolegnia diclina VS20]
MTINNDDLRALTPADAFDYFTYGEWTISPMEIQRTYCLQANDDDGLGPGLWVLRKIADVGQPPIKASPMASSEYAEVEIATRISHAPRPCTASAVPVAVSPSAVDVSSDNGYEFGDEAGMEDDAEANMELNDAAPAPLFATSPPAPTVAASIQSTPVKVTLPPRTTGISPTQASSKMAVRRPNKRPLDPSTSLQLLPSTPLEIDDDMLTVEVARAHVGPLVHSPLDLESDFTATTKSTTPLWTRLRSGFDSMLTDGWSCPAPLTTVDEDAMYYDMEDFHDSPLDVTVALATTSVPDAPVAKARKRRKTAATPTPTPRRMTRSQTKLKLERQGISEANMLEHPRNSVDPPRQWQRWQSCGHLHSTGSACCDHHHQ